ncbi:DUF378 domain-containing protein [bacterium]|nr:DUF378 domain-containing protein [bacterium]
MNFLRYMAYALVLIGALNWGLIGLFNFDLVAAIFGNMTLISRIIYSLVGISALIAAFMLPSCNNIENVNKDEYSRCSL